MGFNARYGDAYGKLYTSKRLQTYLLDSVNVGCFCKLYISNLVYLLRHECIGSQLHTHVYVLITVHKLKC